jgi:hypothetical protein
MTLKFFAFRETVIVNLDPGNDVLPYKCAVDVMDLIKLEDVMRDMQLGPNGGENTVHASADWCLFASLSCT